MSDPKAVAQAYYEADYACGEEGAGRQYDLASSPTYGRDDVLRAERRDGCKPRRVPKLRVALLVQRGDFASVEITNPDAAKREADYQPERFLLVRQGREWRVDQQRSPDPDSG